MIGTRVPSRTLIAQGIKELINVQGATEVTLTFQADEANQLADDLLWCAKSTDRHYRAEKITGNKMEPISDE